MLVKCAECGNDVSSEAIACPRCGHPRVPASSCTQAPAGATGSKPGQAPPNSAPATHPAVPHLWGWLALAAVVLAMMTPAILAPILVLAALVFAGKELSDGGRKFGGSMLALALLQGWFVIDHFSHLSGSLGVTTAQESTAQAAGQYANVSLDLPAGWRETAQTTCHDEWPTDFQMQLHCVGEQEQAAQQLLLGAPAGLDDATFRVIRGMCQHEWPTDFQMRAHCESEQVQSYRALAATQTGNAKRNGCAQQWPNDFQMRQYCENH